jgi:hypothetical protein
VDFIQDPTKLKNMWRKKTAPAIIMGVNPVPTGNTRKSARATVMINARAAIPRANVPVIRFFRRAHPFDMAKPARAQKNVAATEQTNAMESETPNV